MIEGKGGERRMQSKADLNVTERKRGGGTWSDGENEA